MGFGGECWYCYWGWAKVVADIFDEAVKELGGDDSALKYGPGHVVWSDENWDLAESCLEREHFEEFSKTLTAEEKAVVRLSLEKLAAVPLEQREVCPDDYDGQHPEKYPPAAGVVMVAAR